MNIKGKINQINFLVNSGAYNLTLTEDIYALQLVNGLLQQGDYLPLNAMALRPYALSFLMNELFINSRKQIIEFGAGISTVLLGRLIKSSGLDTQITSIDESEEWVRFMRQKLADEKLTECIQIIHAPLEPKTGPYGKPHWYNEEYILNNIQSKQFDMVLVDGPTAYNRDIEWSRYFALPFIKKRLTENFAIFLDDANRQGEKNILKEWSVQFKLSFQIFAGTLGVGYQGVHFESNPIRHVAVENISF